MPLLPPGFRAPARTDVLLAKSFGAFATFWFLWRLKHDWQHTLVRDRRSLVMVWVCE
jgi:hypothetical protein